MALGVPSGDPLLVGHGEEGGLIAVEPVPARRGRDSVVLFLRRGAETVRRREAFTPFLLLADRALLSAAPPPLAVDALSGPGLLRWRADFATWTDCQKARAAVARETGIAATDPAAPYGWISDPVQQYLTRSGHTLFKGMDFPDLRRLQVDIECLTAEGFEFCNAEREQDRIIVIALADQTGWREVLSGAGRTERELLERFVAVVRERDPDVIEGHNVFNFDLPYLAARAARHGVPLALGRDGSEPRVRPSRFSVGERVIAYSRFEIHGRHVVDTLFLTHAYDITHRSLEGHGLKEVAAHFGIAAPDRTPLEGSEIPAVWRSDPERVLRYAGDDVAETEALSRVLSPSSFVQSQIVPLSYQSVCVRGTAAKIDALMLREYLRQGAAVPLPDQPRPFAGGYTDLFERGVVREVRHCDVRSLYPSLMLAQRIGPRTDDRGVFLRLLEALRSYRLDARRRMGEAATEAERRHLDALQSAFKVLINSFYGYLGFAQARFSDFSAAERVTAEGRALVQRMVEWLRAEGARPIEVDTDGIYFVPPAWTAPGAEAAFRQRFDAWLPEGIEVEFDGRYAAMFSYKMKNYALLTDTGDVVIKGAALRSRGLERFQRDFLRELIRLKLEGREAEAPELKEAYARAIREGAWPIAMLARTETLQDAPAAYAAKVGGKARGRSAVYELALKSGRAYRAGDQVSYYVTGTRKSVSVHAQAKLASEWRADARDENVPYYLAKLEGLYVRFAAGELGPEAAEEQGEGE